ncbi:MAG TPA: hypothetical protein VGN12_02005 [Pirellulales bacterium]|jgi:hypothetical protein
MNKGHSGGWNLFGLIIVSLVIAVLAGAAGCGRSSNDTPEQLTLYSIDGREERRNSVTEQRFQGYPVLGWLDIEDADDRKAIMSAVEQGIAQSNGKPPVCFSPRYGIQAMRHDKSSAYVISFQCLQLQVIHDDATIMKTTTAAPEAVLNGYLTKAGIPLAPE